MDLWYTEHASCSSLSLKVKKSLFSDQSAFQKVDVVETEGFGRLLLLDGLVMTTDRDEFIYHEMISHVPLFALPEPAKKALVIGGGDGGTVREILKHASIEEVVLCEIDGMVIDVCKEFFPAIASELNNPKLRTEVRDGVAFVANEPDNTYDLVVIDSTDPMGPGTGLFTPEFYAQVSRILKPNGIMTAQTESPFSQEEGLRKIFANLRQVFPVTMGYWGVIPTYPGQLWTWGFCSKGVTPFEHVTREKVAAISKDARYYNYDVHVGAFALPNFVANLVQSPQQEQIALQGALKPALASV